MDNPFVYGEVVPLNAFVNRRQELERLTADLLAGQKVFLISPRRYGKSSLIAQALRVAARRGALVAEVTVSSYSSYVAFLEGLARALVGLDTHVDRVKTWLRDAVAAIRPEVHLEADERGSGQLAVSFAAARTERDVTRLAGEIFALPSRIADARRRRLIVALDEFQAIAGFDSGTVEHTLRAAIQHQRQVGYVFAGSEPSLMERMLTPKRPFYKAGPVLRLGKIPSDEFATFIEARFERTGIRPESGLGASLVELAGNLPYDVQRLAHETWDDVRGAGRRTVGLEDLHGTLRRLLTEQDILFEEAWQRLTLLQRAVLRAIVLEEGQELFSADVRIRHRLGPPSSVQTAVRGLMREDLIAREGERYAVIDSLMREWVARKTH